MNWATNHDAIIEKLEKVQGSLTVGLIMVPRVDLLCCFPQQAASSVKAKNIKRYSALPVEAEDGKLLGLYDAGRWFSKEAPSQPIKDDFLPLSESMLIGADASIFDFIREADQHPTRLVVSGNQITGLISISDLQQLPVRAALFALITSLEMAMALAIDKYWQEKTEAWLELLDNHRQKSLRKDARRAENNDTFVSYSVLTQFSDKSAIVQNLPTLQGEHGLDAEVFEALRILRNDIAHANCYADTEHKAHNVCRLVREVFKIKTLLAKTVPIAKATK